MAKKKSPTKPKRDNRKVLQHERVKETVRLTPALMQTVERVAMHLGTTKNSFFTLAVAKLSADLVPVCYEDGLQKERALAQLEDEITQIVAEARA